MIQRQIPEQGVSFQMVDLVTEKRSAVAHFRETRNPQKACIPFSVRPGLEVHGSTKHEEQK